MAKKSVKSVNGNATYIAMGMQPSGGAKKSRPKAKAKRSKK